MTDTADFGRATGDSTFGYDDLRLDPRYGTDDSTQPSPVWATSQRLRELIDRQEAKPPADDRQFLAEALGRQVNTLGLYREIHRLGPPDPKNRKTASLYLLLFPGEGRDNTGIKDLNDKVIGYDLTSEFVLARQDEIKKLFPPGVMSGPRFAAVGQDYKTATIFAVDKKPLDFKNDLVKLDAALRVRLLDILAKAKKQVKDPKKQKEIDNLIKKLRKEGYRFDFLFGVNTLELQGFEMDMLFQLLTEAAKGAGMARFAAKAATLSFKYSRQLAGMRGIEKAETGHDPRGRVFEIRRFLRVAAAVREFKAAMSVIPAKGSSPPFDLLTAWVNGNWILVFAEHVRLLWANPDVIRDVRKKLLEPPPTKNGAKLSFAPQVELLELWLIAVNVIDFVKEFIADTEYLSSLRLRHVIALAALEEVENAAKPVDWPRLTAILSRDHRGTRDPFAMLGRASEYQFYSYAADHPDRVIFSMDIRDLGVELVSSYEMAIKEIDDNQRGELDLLDRTLLVTDPLVERKRFTYDLVLSVFRKYHSQLGQIGGVQQAVDRAFGRPVVGGITPPDFPQSLQVMLGGDEIFVAAHPSYAAVEHDIIAELAVREFERVRPLNMRTSVAYSSARRAVGRGSSQRKENQAAHDRALRLAGEAQSILKVLERAQRRLELLIAKLAANPKKAVKAQFYEQSLGSLGLLRLYVRVKPLPDEAYRRLRPLLPDEAKWLDAFATTYLELVDFRGTVVDPKQLKARIDELEKKITADVGSDNVYFDVYPLVSRDTAKMVLDIIKKYDKAKKKIDRAQSGGTPPPAPVPTGPVTALARRG